MEEEEEAGEMEEVGFHHGLRTADICPYLSASFGRLISLMAHHCIYYFPLLWLGQQVVAEDEEAKALVGSVGGSTLDPLLVD